jgi:hypothetical protein
MVLKSEEMVNGEEVKKVMETLIKKRGLKGIIGEYKKIERKLFSLYKDIHKYISLLGELTEELLGESNTNFSEVFSNLETLVSEEKGLLFSKLKNFIHNNISLHLNSHQNLKNTYSQESFDVIFQNATYQHLSKVETKQVIGEHLALLRKKGRLYMNLRVSDTGEVFCDNRLNPAATESTDSGMRYYTTFTPAQILEFVADIESGSLFEKLGIQLQEGARFKLVGELKRTKPSNAGSPDFVRIHLERIG